jgi:hypothetical protein
VTGVVGIISGCSKNISELSPQLESHQRVAVAPFLTDKTAQGMERRFAIDLATRLSLAAKDNEWIYDQSSTLNPVAIALTELDQIETIETTNENGVKQEIEVPTIKAAFEAAADKDSEDAALAAAVGEKLGADLILIGSIKKLKIDEEMDSRPAFDMSNQAGISGTTRFILVYQWAEVDIHVIAVDVKTKEIVWNNRGLKGYIKYCREFQTQDPAKEYSRVSELQIRADLRKHMVSRLGNQMMGDVIRGRDIPDYLMKPSRRLIRAGGEVRLK